MESLVLLVSVLLAIGLLGGPIALLLSTQARKIKSRPASIAYKSVVATLAALSILTNAMFLIEHIPITLRLLALAALCTGVIAIKQLFFSRSKNS
ncbi:unannotated protein [freshwater metagenome]|uniref:Unannotated protein n=1 Tax=freshwater metagenome TaxID=449393 RepID=A0A6J6RSR2_9ZZZZ|nr:hypothetical protein [Actinomycetota bacterium]MSY82680.1 hypothetical protein [Actinomycetota bacterium]MTA05211.1 hypothetical protein [Actinomycetota bacterium]